MRKHWAGMLILLAILATALHTILAEAYWAAVLDPLYGGILEFFDIPRTPVSATVVAYILPVSAAAFSLWAAYRFGEMDRISFEPTPDIDPRKAFAKIIEDKSWLKNHTETDPARVRRLVSNYLHVRLAGEIHSALAQEKIWAWGHINLPKGEGPFDRIPATKWQEIDIVFDTDLERRTTARHKNKSELGYFGVTLCAAQVAKCFRISRRKLMR